jgi:HlyD family secretion protein
MSPHPPLSRGALAGHVTRSSRTTRPHQVTRASRAALLLSLFVAAGCTPATPSRIEATGTLEYVETDIAGTTGGRVVRVLVDEGDRVHAGDTLLVLEIPTLPAEIAQRRARVAAARAALDEAVNGPRAQDITAAAATQEALVAEAMRTASDVERLTPLASRDMASAQQLEAAQTAARASAARRDAGAAQLQLLRDGTRPERIAAMRAELAAAQGALAASEATARDLILTAPTDGRILTRRAEPGEVLGAGERALVLAQTERQWVRIFVGQDALPLVRVGQDVTATLDAFPDRPMTGRVSAVATQAEYTPRVALTEKERADLLFAVRAEFRDTTEMLKAGLPVTVRLATPRR